ncbi:MULTISPECIES: cytochrome P450 [unclassified Sinorhizobium]|uniref:cytochrome P450 n=1 Tax=unclassified Sinorhizobium TaxID=2613772 RepID=UPI0024C33544|nr:MULTISPECIES: cytochrome P450 [unclassified Sinorhizobium]MDK1374744.1 cytochrome P450 [Sinorhizobium sp. 6-70]MDK1479073.1 cytochrome P450 [Sinorhizobium sp. 6-117]
MSLPGKTSISPPTLSFASLNAAPHEFYRELRPEFPFARREDGAFLVLRANDVQTLVSDPRTRQIETELVRARGIFGGPVMDLVSNSLLFSNGDTHRRRRQPLSRCFAFRMMESLRPNVRSLAEELVTLKLGDGVMKLRDDYAAAIPAITIAGILGIPRCDVPLFTSLAYRVSKVLTTSWTQDDLPDIEAAINELSSYVSSVIDDRRKRPRADFLSDYVASGDEAAGMSALEAVMQIVSVVLGGTDTTRAAIVIMVGLLLDRQDGLWRALRHQPAMVAAAVSESLRFEPAVASIPRLAVEDISLDGYVIPRGSPVLLSTMSALRDPEVFVDPDHFNLTRPLGKWHPVFGGGEHRCLGEALARIEMEEALAALLSSPLSLELGDQQLSIYGHAGIRQVDELLVRWR